MLFYFLFKVIYLIAPGLSCSTQDLHRVHAYVCVCVCVHATPSKAIVLMGTGCFHVLDVVNSAAVHAEVCISF